MTENNNNNNNNNQNNNNQQKSNRDQGNTGFSFRNNRLALFFLMGVLTLFLVYIFSGNRSSANEIPYSQFLGHLNQGQVESIRILDQYQIEGVLKEVGGSNRNFITNIPYFDAGLVQLLQDRGVRFSGAPRPVSPFQVILNILPWGIGIFFVWFMFRQMQGTGNRALSFGKSKARKVSDNQKKVTFKDVAGQKEAKYELQEVVEFLKNPETFTIVGARIPKGVLLVGMPGTGKTLMARACAGEAGVNFFHMSGSDFVEMFVGVGASRVRDLFEQGRRNAPCIIFIDELDAVGRTRGAGYGGGHDEREQTLNQMLVEMDGFEVKDGVIMLAATNRPDVLDPALLRPGRFDRQVVIDMPDLEDRLSILRIHSNKLPISSDVDIRRIARATPGYSGADLENLCNEAALHAVRRRQSKIAMQDFEDARDKLLMGVARQSKVMSEEERRKTAYHESGHALLHYYCPHSDPLHKVTIVPRGRALGVAISLPEKDTYSHSKNWVLDRIRVIYGGFAAEEMFYDETSTGTKNDLQQATELARRMVTEWGMSNLGPVAMGHDEGPIFLAKDISHSKSYSESTAQKIDEEISRIISECLDDSRRILAEHRTELIALADNLMKHETLDASDVQRILNIDKSDSRTRNSDQP